MSDMAFNNWVLCREAGGLAWLTLDRAGEKTNALSQAVMVELGCVLDLLDASPPRALIIASAKEAGFVAGADIREFSVLDSFDGARALTERGWDLFNRLAALPYPTLALVRGHCLGGGLELALACRYRVVVDEPGTRLGLPEVMLGIYPGWGGMLRLPKLVGPALALDMMLSGKTLDAKSAKRAGLADLCVAPRVMERSAAEYVLSGAAPRQLPLGQRLLNGPLRGLVAARARKQVARRARPEHYPAPHAILEFWSRHDGNALDAPEVIRQIVESPTARNLVRIFHLQERLKAFGKDVDAPIGRVHVVGAGVMGGDIAAWCALHGLTVTLQDQDLAHIAPSVRRASALFDRRLRDPLALCAAQDRLIPDPCGYGAVHADVVIEAVVENLDVKREVLRRLENTMRPDAVLATNTSSLRFEDLRLALASPQRLVGVHFFNPVAKMPLVEVVAPRDADPTMQARACAFVRRIDKLPLPVASAPGFLVNAVLAPYMQEAMRCVDEGMTPEAIDAAVEAFGMPMGPIELADTVGLDVAMAAGQQLVGDGSALPPTCLKTLVDRGDLGRKTGRGFYDYASGKSEKKDAIPVAGLAERLIRPLLLKTQQLVAEGVVADAELADAGVVFGTGFAPFTGGPINYERNRHA